eukprot:3240961-Rhodomonas_salina.1
MLDRGCGTLLASKHGGTDRADLWYQEEEVLIRKQAVKRERELELRIRDEEERRKKAEEEVERLLREAREPRR